VSGLRRAAWDRHYSAAVQSRLPLFGAEAFEPVLAAVQAAGFQEPRVTPLPEVERIERERGQRSASDRGPRVPRDVITALPALTAA
jgi:hypothetical protein